MRGLTGGERSLLRLRLLSASRSPLITRAGDRPSFDGEELVVVPSPFFPHRITEGYSPPFGEIVEAINGIHVKNLAHLVALLRDCHDQFLKIEFSGRLNETMIFPRAAMDLATEEILADNGVRSQGSPDMMAIWHSKADTAPAKNK